jgi:tRNA(Arg) A34 adenosine deaminase TadA
MAARAGALDISPDSEMRARDRALLWRATTLAIESAFSYGLDFPVGAVAAKGDEIIGRHFASDKRHRMRELHAERMAVIEGMAGPLGKSPDTVVVTLEPCKMCQDFLATVPSIKRVGFGLARSEMEERGLAKHHDETIFGRAIRLGLPYEVVQIEDEQLHTAGTIILDNMHRDPITEKVEVDQAGLSRALQELNAQ